MNTYQTTLWNQLSNLVEESEAFYYTDRQLDDKWYRIFNYRLASYTDFLQPSALECRGHMFEVNEEGNNAKVIRLASLPPHKFFNLYENPSTMNLDLSQVDMIMDKKDGSLISTYQHINKLRLKTKGSLESDQALDAMEWLDKKENFEFKQELIAAESAGYTVNMEWVSPTNRIVIGYIQPSLVVLNIRNREDGSYLDVSDIDTFIFPNILKHWVDEYLFDDPITFIESIPDIKDNIEGVVCRLTDGTYFKCKTLKYLALHHTKDSINTPRRLYETVVEGGSDDMRSLLHDDTVAINLIDQMEKFVEQKYNHLVDTVERFYERNKTLSRKDYAILGQQELDSKMFGLAMAKYIGKDVDYKQFMKKNWKHFGIKDEKTSTE